MFLSRFSHSDIKFSYGLINFYLFLLSLFLTTTSFANTNIETLHRQELSANYQQLSVDRERNRVSEIKLNDLPEIHKRQLSDITNRFLTKQMLERARLNVSVAKTDAYSIRQSLREVEQKRVST